MNLTLTADRLRITWTGSERLWAILLKPELVIPLTAITQVSTEPAEMGRWDLRAPGTAWPGVIRAGTYYTQRGRELWSVTAPRDPAGYLVLDLQESHYQRVVLKLSHDLNQMWCDQIRSALA